MGTFVITKRFNDEYKVVFASRKGKTIFTSLSYELKFEGEEDIEKFKANIDLATFLTFKSTKGKFYFKLLLVGVHFATSRKYNTVLGLQKGMDEIVKYAAQSDVLDFSANDIVFLD